MLIIPTTKPVYWAIEFGGEIALTGITNPGDNTAAPHVVHFDENEDGIFNKVSVLKWKDKAKKEKLKDKDAVKEVFASLDGEDKM